MGPGVSVFVAGSTAVRERGMNAAVVRETRRLITAIAKITLWRMMERSMLRKYVAQAQFIMYW